MGGKEKEGRVGVRGEEKGGEGKGDRMWRGPESGLPQGPCWLSAGLLTLAYYYCGLRLGHPRQKVCVRLV